jgi:hypothetical protein
MSIEDHGAQSNPTMAPISAPTTSIENLKWLSMAGYESYVARRLQACGKFGVERVSHYVNWRFETGPTIHL